MDKKNLYKLFGQPSIDKLAQKGTIAQLGPFIVAGPVTWNLLLSALIPTIALICTKRQSMQRD